MRSTISIYVTLGSLLLVMNTQCSSKNEPALGKPSIQSFQESRPEYSPLGDKSGPEYQTIHSRAIRKPQSPELLVAAEESLAKFLKLLKSFISRGRFDYMGFEARAEILKAEFSILEERVYSVPYTEDLAKRVHYVESMLQRMSGSVSELTHYSLCKDPECAWVYKMVELNISLFFLRDSNGALDYSLKDYMGRLLHFWRQAITWEKNMNDLEDVPELPSSLFHKEVRLAESTIRFLILQLPNEVYFICHGSE